MGRNQTNTTFPEWFRGAARDQTMRIGALLTLLTALAGVGSHEAATEQASAIPTASRPGSIIVTSPDFQNGGTLALGHSYAGLGCAGSNRSPALSWRAVAGARSYAVTLFDPDAPAGGWWHWTVANIPASTTSLAPGAGGQRAVLPPGIVQGRNDFGMSAYGGPCPPVGDRPHHYVFTVYALASETLPVDGSTGGAAFTTAAEGSAIAKGEITGLYGR